ncbi:DUF6578 domain-containing protein [Microbacterium radiodurans]|uniref:Uncharacterized protein n=1 Tax=Microbacterium radiodurans TaxID=661398 RepID=A0A5J5IP23_9MICO|nr:DUF6578 domain-containing protein [Microbacterium radiodurans]KAA9084145.1 hypothetical protein F6B42_14290 [Microbacterium radiodurans]
MRIAVVISEWEQACCGDPFHVDGPASWQLFAADPADGAVAPAAAEGLERFTEEHHGQTPADVPHQRVTGTVRSIWGVRYPEVAVPGELASFVNDTRAPSFVQIDDVAGATDGVAEYVVVLEVASDLELPVYKLSEETIAWESRKALDRDRDRGRMVDEIGTVMEHAIQVVTARYHDVATITRSTQRTAVTLIPLRTGAAAVRWARSDQETDQIGLHIGAGSWWLDATVDSANLLEGIVDAVAAGNAVEEVITDPDGGRRLETHVTAAGREWVTATGHVPPPDESGVMFIVGDVWERAQQGTTRYTPWHY